MAIHYKLLKKFESPTGTIHPGVIKTENDWKLIFSGLHTEDCSIKDDWFEPIESLILSNLKEDDNIFCIIFRGKKIYNADYVKLSLYPRIEETDEWIDFSTAHNKKPMGCSASFNKHYFNKHYFIYLGFSDIRFFTLKPELWAEDLHKSIEYEIKQKELTFKADIKKLREEIDNFTTDNRLSEYFT